MVHLCHSCRRSIFHISLSNIKAGVLLPRLSLDTRNMENRTPARMAKVDHGLTMCTRSRTRSSLQPRNRSHTPILDAGKTLEIVLYHRWMALTQGLEETTELVLTRSTSATRSLVKGIGDFRCPTSRLVCCCQDF